MPRREEKEWLIVDQRRCEKFGGHADDRHQRPPRRAMDWPDVPAEPPDVSLALPQATLELPHPTFKPSHVTLTRPHVAIGCPHLAIGCPHRTIRFRHLSSGLNISTVTAGDSRPRFCLSTAPAAHVPGQPHISLRSFRLDAANRTLHKADEDTDLLQPSKRRRASLHRRRKRSSYSSPMNRPHSRVATTTNQ